MKQIARYFIRKVRKTPNMAVCSCLVGAGAVLIVFGVLRQSVPHMLAGSLGSFALFGGIYGLQHKRQLRSVIQKMRALNKDLIFENEQRKLAEKALEFHIERDTLTGLATFRYFVSRAELAIARARRSGKLMSVIFFAIDRFDMAEEKLGPVGADDLTRTTATICREAVRDVDLPAWYERNIFTVLLEETATDEATNVVARLRHRLEAIPVSDEKDSEPISVSMSLVEIDAAHHSLTKGLRLGRDALDGAIADGPKGFRLAKFPTEDGRSQPVNEKRSTLVHMKAA